jgi:hypothetical protein
VSFFDEGEPSRRERAARTRRPGAVSARGASTDSQTLLVRRGVALVVGLLLLILLVVGIDACRDNARENALRDYTRDIGSVAQQSDDVADDLFATLGREDVTPVDQQTQINQLRVRAERLAERARGLEVPDAMQQAQMNALLALDLRAGATGRIAERLPAARGDQEGAAEEATQHIAGQMRAFDASDVLWSQRVVPFTRGALSEAEISGVRVQGSETLPSIHWLQPQTVAQRIGGSAGAGGGGDDETVAPGRHGHGLSGVSIGDVQLQPPPTVNDVPVSAGLNFTVTFENQGENDETGVRVRVTVRPPTGDPISATRTVDQTAAGATVTVPVRLAQEPPTGSAVRVEVEVLRVPGEENVENNSQEYLVLFRS